MKMKSYCISVIQIIRYNLGILQHKEAYFFIFGVLKSGWLWDDARRLIINGFSARGVAETWEGIIRAELLA